MPDSPLATPEFMISDILTLAQKVDLHPDLIDALRKEIIEQHGPDAGVFVSEIDSETALEIFSVLNDEKHRIHDLLPHRWLKTGSRNRIEFYDVPFDDEYSGMLEGARRLASLIEFCNELLKMVSECKGYDPLNHRITDFSRMLFDLFGNNPQKYRGQNPLASFGVRLRPDLTVSNLTDDTAALARGRYAEEVREDN